VVKNGWVVTTILGIITLNNVVKNNPTLSITTQIG